MNRRAIREEQAHALLATGSAQKALARMTTVADTHGLPPPSADSRPMVIRSTAGSSVCLFIGLQSKSSSVRLLAVGRIESEETYAVYPFTAAEVQHINELANDLVNAGLPVRDVELGVW